MTTDLQIVRAGELVPCRTAFIDAHTPGSDKKENFTIIGGGVSESPDQHVHIKETPGFNIGAAGQPPGCRNSMHTHRTAEVFYVQSGRWRFFWGQHGTAGEVILEEGDIFNIPTQVFRGFENIGESHGLIMAILGGDDAGGGVVWAPHVIEEARDHGLVLAETGRLYDTKRGEALPEGVSPMRLLSEEELKVFPETPTEEVVPRFIGRYMDMRARSAKAPTTVIGGGNSAMINDKPGFQVDFASGPVESYSTDRQEVLMVFRGWWRVRRGDHEELLAPGDTCWIAAGEVRSFEPSQSGEAGLYRVTATDDPPGPTVW